MRAIRRAARGESGTIDLSRGGGSCMINKTVLLLAVAAGLASARTASAQSAFGDVPPQHWANGAVKELQLRGILTGYPDGTFGGKRAVTRYEFALAGQRVLKDVQRRIDAAV